MEEDEGWMSRCNQTKFVMQVDFNLGMDGWMEGEER